MRCTDAFALTLVAVGLAACSSDSSGPGVGFECLGAALPTTAPSTIVVSGQVKHSALAPTALPGAQILAFRTTAPDTIAGDTTDTAGLYSLTVTTGGTPVNGYVRVSKSGQLDTYAYPSRPLTADATTNVLSITSAEFNALAGLVQVTPTAGSGFIAVIVKDCNGTPISGATVTTNPPGTVRYDDGTTPSPNRAVTSGDGVAYVFNVTAGDVIVMANGGGHPLRQHTVKARADAVTLTEIQP